MSLFFFYKYCYSRKTLQFLSEEHLVLCGFHIVYKNQSDYFISMYIASAPFLLNGRVLFITFIPIKLWTVYKVTRKMQIKKKNHGKS